MNHVLIDCERTKFPNTGLFHFCNSLGNALLEQHDPATEKFSFYVPPKQQRLFGKNADYILQHSLHKFYLPGAAKFDVWHCCFQSSNYLPSSKKPALLLTIHDLNFLIEHANEPARIKKYLKKVQDNVNRADHLVFISNFTKDSVLEHIKLNGQTTEVIYNGYNITQYPGFDEPAYRPLRPFIFSIGTVLPKKNFHVLPALLKSNDYELVIAGIINTDYEQKIWEQAKLHGVADRVKLIGPVNEKDKYWYYKNCLAFAFPSLAEGFGAPPVEAMYYGKPVFLSTKTSLPEIGGDAAYYFDDFEPEIMQRVFERGMEHYNTHHPEAYIHERTVRLFNWPNVGNSYLAAYRALYNK